MTNSRAYVLSQSLSPLPTGARGELCIGGVQVSLGYLGPAASTSERFVEDPVNPGSRLYRTGDLVRWRSEGVLQFLGRLDAGFDPRDMRADTSEIEGSLRSCPSVSDVVVAMQQSPGGETERLVAYIVSAHPGEELEQELRRLAERDLGPMARPASYVLLASFPRLPSGKIDRQRLPRPGTSAPSSLGASASGKPRTALERAILAVWETHLSTNGIDPSANFFDLGGDSLGAIRTMQELSEQMGIELPVVSLFQYPTVLSLAAHLSQIGNAPGVDRPLGARDQQRIEKRRGALSSHRKPPRADEP